jgi:hypothetical protein
MQPDVTMLYSSHMDQNHVSILLNELAVMNRSLSGAPLELLSCFGTVWHRVSLGQSDADTIVAIGYRKILHSAVLIWCVITHCRYH